MQVLTVNTSNTAASTVAASFVTISNATQEVADTFIGRKLFFYNSTNGKFLQGTSITDSSWDAANSEIILTYQQLAGAAPADGAEAILV